MVAPTEPNPSQEDGLADRDNAGGNPRTDGKAVFNPKGIGSNVLLTTAAAVVPIVIVGIAGVKTFFGAKKSKR